MSSINKRIKYAVATGHHLTSKVAYDILEAGGNAFDATVAAFLLMSITEPAMSSAFAGGFVNIHSVERGNLLIDYFTQTPVSKQLAKPKYEEIIVDFGASKESFYAGPASMAVSGAMYMIHHLIDHFCTMPLKELAKPAQEYAVNGVALTNFQAVDLELLKSIFGLNESGRNIFFNMDGLKKQGDFIKMSAYSDFLESFAREKQDWVYRGEIAHSLVKHCEENGGYLTHADFESYQLKISKPFMFKLGDIDISVPGLPSLGGGLMYKYTKALWKDVNASNTKEYFARSVEAFDLCEPYLKDGTKLFEDIAYNGHSMSSNIMTNGTSHFNILDKKGNAVSLSVSIGEGSGYFIPNTDIHVNNMLGETALLPNGLDSWQLNQRLSSMMCPLLAYQDHRLIMSAGTGGATRIPFSLAQVLYNRFKLNKSLLEAIKAPRMYKNSQVCYLESGINYTEELIDVDVKQWSEPELLFGGVHGIDMLEGEAQGDSRREGNALIKYT